MKHTATTLVSATHTCRRHRRRRTRGARYMPGQPPADHDPPIRTISGREHTNRAGLAQLAGWKPGNSVNVRAKTDPDFPAGVKDGREYWYPLHGPGGVTEYLALLQERQQAKKPPAVEPGDPDELLGVEPAAAAIHVTPATYRFYVRLSLPYWPEPYGQGHEGRPILPPPDHVEEGRKPLGATYPVRQWRRGTLAAHQAIRPGPGTGAGRPSQEQT